jgi:hypothetical protein
MMNDKYLFSLAKEFVTEQSAGEWDDKTITKDANKLVVLLKRVADEAAQERSEFEFECQGLA